MYKDVPAGQVIVGIQVGERGNDLWAISRVGFRMATIENDEKPTVKPFVPTEICDHLEFGDRMYVCNNTWDNLKAFKKPSKLIGIKVQHDGEGDPLHGIQLLFQNNIKTDTQMTEAGRDDVVDWHTIKIDPEKTIKTIGVKKNHDSADGAIHGIKIFSDDYEELCNVTWATGNAEEGHWIHRDVPEGQQICGLATCTGQTEDGPFLKNIQFLLGTNPSVVLPKPAQKGAWTPKLCPPLSFGHVDAEVDYSFPTAAQLYALNGPPTLKGFRFKADRDDGPLGGIQIHFNEFRSGFYQTTESTFADWTM